jgi:predicted TIM-barrel fold metal-dependent hydrolase
MFSIDYPHEITLFGSTQQVLAELTEGLDEEVKRALLAGTAMKVYNLVDDVAEADAHPRETVAVTS